MVQDIGYLPSTFREGNKVPSFSFKTTNESRVDSSPRHMNQPEHHMALQMHGSPFGQTLPRFGVRVLAPQGTGGNLGGPPAV